MYQAIFLDFKFCHVLNVVFFLLGESRDSEFYGTQNSDARESSKRKNTISFSLSRQTGYEYTHKLHRKILFLSNQLQNILMGETFML